jgi:hypothetical protein
MTNFQREMVEKAKEKYGNDITFIGDKKNWEDCFSEYKDIVQLWFNVGQTTGFVLRKKSGEYMGTLAETANKIATEILAQSKTVFTIVSKERIKELLENDFDDLTDNEFMELAHHYNMPYGTAKARTGDPFEFLHSRLSDEID